MIHLESFKENEIEILSPMMRDSFDNDSLIHRGIKDGPNGYDNGTFIQKWFMHKNATPLTIYNDDKIIGGVNLWINNETNKNVLGCLFLDPLYINKGIGTIVWKQIEERYPDTIEWKTETPIFSHRNHHFYINKCGFACVKIENPKDLNEGSFILVKKMK